VTKRGRPKDNATLEELEAAVQRARRVEQLFAEAYRRLRPGCSNERQANGGATRAVAAEIGLSDRQIRTIRKFFREEIAPMDRRDEELASSPEARAFHEMLEAARTILSPAEWAGLSRVHVDPWLQVMKRVVDGAAAERENERLRAEINTLKEQIKVWKDIARRSRK